MHVRTGKDAKADAAAGIEAARGQQQPEASGRDQIIAGQADAGGEPDTIGLADHQRQIVLDQRGDFRGAEFGRSGRGFGRCVGVFLETIRAHPIRPTIVGSTPAGISVAPSTTIWREARRATRSKMRRVCGETTTAGISPAFAAASPVALWTASVAVRSTCGSVSIF